MTSSLALPDSGFALDWWRGRWIGDGAGTARVQIGAMPKKKSAVALAASISPSTIESRIHLIRGFRVMLDSDLAELYGVATGNLNRAVSRNSARFPVDFSFVLTRPEQENLIFQIGISSLHGGRRAPTRVFTEQGVAMLSSVLRSRRAAAVNVAIMRAFVHLRELLASHKDLARRIDELEQRYDGNFAAVFDAIRGLMSPPAEQERRARIGFITDPKTPGSTADVLRRRMSRKSPTKPVKRSQT